MQLSSWESHPTKATRLDTPYFLAGGGVSFFVAMDLVESEPTSESYSTLYVLVPSLLKSALLNSMVTGLLFFNVNIKTVFTFLPGRRALFKLSCSA